MSKKTIMTKSNFRPAKAPPRRTVTVSILNLDAAERARQFGLDYKHAEMVLGDDYFKFDPETGQWNYNLPPVDDQAKGVKSNIKSTPNANLTSQTSLDQDMEPLLQENNLLKAKNAILLDMVAELASEANLKFKETNTTDNNKN